MRAPDRRPRMPHRGPVGAALVVGARPRRRAGRVRWSPPTPDRRPRRSPAAWPPRPRPSISPICDAPDPTGILGPSSNLPSNPTTTLVTPPGGVVNFTATSSNLYVDTGSQLITYTLAGAEVGSFALPPAIVNRHGNEVTQPVVDPSGNIYMASYYDQVLDKFSPERPAALVGGPRRATTPPGSSRSAPARASSSLLSDVQTQSGQRSDRSVHRCGDRVLPACSTTSTT